LYRGSSINAKSHQQVGRVMATASFGPFKAWTLKVLARNLEILRLKEVSRVGTMHW
jgi:hypothetical protein